MNEETKKALDLIKSVCAAFQGNLEQHQAIQGSVILIEKELSKEEEVSE